jgi:hypothetical protein
VSSRAKRLRVGFKIFQGVLGSLGAILLIGPYGFEVWKNVNMFDL